MKKQNITKMIDSDSDTDLLQSNVFTSTSISVKGPNTRNISMSFRNNTLKANSNVHQYSEWPRSHIIDHQIVNNRRETSPMSIRSANDLHSRNFNHSHNFRGMSSQRSVVNERSGSPMSMRSIGSNVSAVDIATAIKNAQFSKNDLKIIQKACNRFMKHQIRKSIEKRRKFNVFHKKMRRRSSSERELSDSSISSDDCRSTRTSVYKENMSSCRSTRTDISKFKRTLQESNMYKDYSSNIKQNSFRNMFSIGPANFTSKKSYENISQSMFQKEHKNAFLLPSQRFNKSVAASTIPENVDITHKNNKSRQECVNILTNRVADSGESEQEEIFSNIPVKEKTAHMEHKHNFDNSDDIIKSRRLRNRLSPIAKVTDTNTNDKLRNNGICKNTDRADDSVFIKPLLPVRKSANMRKNQETLIAKSSQPIITSIEKEISPKNLSHSKQESTINEKDKDTSDNNDYSEKHTVSDISMRPSFIKRKLFSQKLDIQEKRNISIDDPANSPQTVYSAIQKEKNKTRKVVTTQSCLSRDVQSEDNNMLDLIHKIVPADLINVTNQTNKIRTEANRNKTDSDDKWDVTSIISTSNNDNMSDTYTDEEIFGEDNVKKTVKPKLNTNNKRKSQSKQECKIVVEKLKPKERQQQHGDSGKMEGTTSNANDAKMKYIKLFWDTGFESDFESLDLPYMTRSLKEKYKSVNLSNNITMSHKTNVDLKLNKKSLCNDLQPTFDNTAADVSKLNSTSLRIKSHRAPKRKKCCQPDEPITTKCKPQNKIKKPKQDDCNKSKTVLNNSHSSCDVQSALKSNKTGHKKCNTPKSKKQKVTPKPDKSKFNSHQEHNRDTRSADLSNVAKETVAKSKAIVNTRNSNRIRACRTPKQNVRTVVSKSNKYY